MNSPPTKKIKKKPIDKVSKKCYTIYVKRKGIDIMAKKTTKKENFTTIRDLLAQMGHEELVAVMDHEIDLLNNKKNGEKKLSEEQKINIEIKDQIIAYMEDGKAYTVTDLQKALNIKSNQKTSALVTQLKDVGKIERFEEKGKAYFKLANA